MVKHVKMSSFLTSDFLRAIPFEILRGGWNGIAYSQVSFLTDFGILIIHECISVHRLVPSIIV